MEEGQLVSFEERCVVVDHGLRELCYGGCGADGEGAEADAAHKDIGGVLGHADTGEAATGNLVRCEDGAAVKSHRLGDVHLDDTEIGLDEGIVGVHTDRQVFEPTAEHGIELAVDGTEIRPLGADAHLPCGAERCCGFDWQFTNDGSRLCLTVKHLTHFTTDASINSIDFCHNVFPFCF